MAFQKGKQRVLLAQGILCLVLVVLQYLTPVSALQLRLTSALLLPIEHAATRLVLHLPVVTFMSDAWSAHQQVEALRGERDALFREVVMLRTKDDERRALEATLALLREHAVQSVVSPLILYPRSQVVLGSSDGITMGNPVFSRTGLIGVIGEVRAHTATLTLLTSDEVRLPVMHQASKAQGLLTANDGVMRVTFLSLIPSIQPGDVIVTLATRDGLATGEVVGKVAAIETKLSDPVTKVRIESVVFPITDTQVVVMKGAL